MTLTAAHLVGLGCAELQEVLGAFGLSHEIQGFVIVLHDGPIWIVATDRRLNLEPIRELYEQANIFALVELFANSRSTSES